MRICDRCGQIISNTNNLYKTFPYYKIIITRQNKNLTKEQINLCDKCKRDVIIFIKGKKYLEE